MTAHELPIPREGDVALDDPGSHARGGNVGLARMLGVEHRRAAVGDGESGCAERPLPALLGIQPGFQGTLPHIVDEEIRPWADLDVTRDGFRCPGC